MSLTKRPGILRMSNPTPQKPKGNPVSAIRPAAVVVLAAGEGTRMKSATPKVLHEICGRSLVGHVLAAARELQPENLVVVVGHAREKVTAHLAEVDTEVRTAVQAQQNGTGHAVRMALEELGGSVDGTVVVVCGDTPLLTGETLQQLAATHSADGNAVTVLTAEVPDATGYGRIVREGASGAVTAIVEHKDASESQRAIREINSGVFAFDGQLLADALGKGAYGQLAGRGVPDRRPGHPARGRPPGSAPPSPATTVRSPGSTTACSCPRRGGSSTTGCSPVRCSPASPSSTPRRRGSTSASRSSRTPPSHPGTQLHGSTHLGEGAVVGPHSRLTDTRVGAGARVDNTVADSAEVGPGATVGPYAYLRPGTRLGAKSKVGTYVETKNASIGEGTKVPHLSYVGDATIGEHTNIGAASVFVNYDGQDKHHTTIGSHCRTGSDNMFVAPVTVGDGAYTAAGSVIHGRTCRRFAGRGPRPAAEYRGLGGP
ncbi:Bifunctional protein GlmU OS=Streptomyces alboniger OX=132473 GN=glmU PE=3 SV=1 [Streptomyces alboniger]